MSVVTLLTDFGGRDGYTGAMKGVILGIAPDARLVDIAHELPQGDIEGAAWVLGQYWSLFPEGTVHLAVVDPGVGGARRPLALEADGRFVVAPDNGLVTPVLSAVETFDCVAIARTELLRPAISRTFHGRDVFAPAAGRLASGTGLHDLGPPIDSPVRLELPAPVREAEEVRGRVAYVDRFGNLISDIPAEWVGPGWRFELDERGVGPLRGTYSEVDRGDVVVVIGSMDTVEIAVRDGSAAETLGLGRGAAVRGRRA